MWEGRLHHAVADLLGSVADEPGWSRALERYAASFGADLLGGAFLATGLDQLASWGAAFAARPDVGHWLQAPSSDGAPALLAMGVTPEAARLYAAQYRFQDPLWQAADVERTRAGEASWVVTDAPVQQTGSFRRTALYHEFLRPFEIGTRLFAGSRSSRHPAGRLFMSIYRQGKEQNFSRAEIGRFAAEFQAVQHAAYLHREMTALRTRTRGLETLMEALPLGVVFLDTAGRLLHANARARILAAQPGNPTLRELLRQPGLVNASDAALRALFAQALQGRGGCLELPGGLLLVTLALRELNGLGLGHHAPGIACVVMERSLDSREAVALASQAYDLSRSESALLLALMRGQSPQEFADTRGVRISTVRTQLSALLEKTRTPRQQELIALVARLMLLSSAQAAGDPPLPPAR